MYEIFGLPVHPLVVHAVVVLLPLSALGLIACVFIGRLRQAYAGLAVLGLVAGTASAFVAAASGQALADRVGLPATHAAWGAWLPWVSTFALAAAAVWYFLQRGKAQPTPAGTASGIVAAVASAAALAVTVLVGHSGATAVWAGTPASASASASSSPSASTASATAAPSTSASASASPSATTTATTYTMAEVAQHNSQESCWAAINGGVYDLTTWISQHPGGSERIIPLCGTDATAAFEAQHQGQERPESTLTQFYIGDVA